MAGADLAGVDRVVAEGGVRDVAVLVAEEADDGRVDITDAVFINFQFSGGRAILPPYPYCETDPGGDDGIACGRSSQDCL